MTLELLERYIQSEVKNLHFRIDQIHPILEAIEHRLDRLEQQMTLTLVIKQAVG